MTARIIIPEDRLLAPVVDPVSRKLEALGYAICRAPQSQRPADWPELAEAAVVVLTPRTPFGAAEIAAAPQLKGIVFPTIGVNSLDLEAADAAGLVVAHGATSEAIDSMAEANVMLMAALLLDLPRKSRGLLQNGWQDGTVRARMMRGKTVGFVGFGRIARATLARLANWGVRSVYFDPFVDQSAAAGATRMPDLPMLLRLSDIVTVLVDLTPETRGMIASPELSTMRPEAYLVNTARGAVVDEAALVQALRFGIIAGAAIDAFEAEPLPADSPLRTLDNVILTPHNIGHTVELQASFVAAAQENVVRIARGEPPPYLKNPDVLPRWRERLARLR